MDALYGVDSVDDVQDCKLVGSAGEQTAAMQAAMRVDDAAAAEGLEDLVEVAHGDAGGVGNFTCGSRSMEVLGEEGHGPEGVFGSLGKQN